MKELCCNYDYDYLMPFASWSYKKSCKTYKTTSKNCLDVK